MGLPPDLATMKSCDLFRIIDIEDIGDVIDFCEGEDEGKNASARSRINIIDDRNSQTNVLAAITD